MWLLMRVRDPAGVCEDLCYEWAVTRIDRQEAKKLVAQYEAFASLRDVCPNVSSASFMLPPPNVLVFSRHTESYDDVGSGALELTPLPQTDEVFILPEDYALDKPSMEGEPFREFTTDCTEFEKVVFAGDLGDARFFFRAYVEEILMETVAAPVTLLDQIAASP
jgi:hypothetical protein